MQIEYGDENKIILTVSNGLLEGDEILCVSQTHVTSQPVYENEQPYVDNALVDKAWAMLADALPGRWVRQESGLFILLGAGMWTARLDHGLVTVSYSPFPGEVFDFHDLLFGGVEQSFNRLRRTVLYSSQKGTRLGSLDEKTLVEWLNLVHPARNPRDGIQVFPFDKAPDYLQVLASQGGDEDWIVVIPKDLAPTVLLYGAPHWIDATDSCHEPVRFDLPNGDVLFVGCH